jgi:A/G-specific adenine glycosylase
MKPIDFQQLVWNFYEEHGRSDLPWRQTNDGYAIYISEIMLQQTQASRVVPKYKDWLKDLPDFQSVASAPTKEILLHWQGLGYNRRALYIKETCHKVMDTYDGRLPQSEKELLDLPGVGPYTTGALQAFVYNLPVVFIETNIRTVFIHHFFPGKDNVTDAEIKEVVAETLPEDKAKKWYWALMDYGSHLKKTVGNLNKKSKSYQKQSTFSGSNRQLRAALTRYILEHEPATMKDMEQEFSKLINKNERMESLKHNLKQLEDEGFLRQTGSTYQTTD